jgi:hypothetical protein
VSHLLTILLLVVVVVLVVGKLVYLILVEAAGEDI